MRNWITDKFGRNRVRTPRAQPSPAPRPAPAPRGGSVVHTMNNGIQYWYYDEMATSTVTYAGIDRSQWIRWWDGDPLPPPFPEKLRLPEGV